jgi:hypothetical protein
MRLLPRLSLARFGLFAGILAGAAVMAVPAAAANNSEQVVFSKTGAFSETLGPFGFWIWCEADSGNPYQGECNGSMYFYAFGTPRHVMDGSISEGPDGIYTIHVVSADGFIDCTLTNTAPAVHGPNNTVSVTCSAPVVGSATAAGSVVNVTGPS